MRSLLSGEGVRRFLWAITLTVSAAAAVVCQPAIPGALSDPLREHVKNERFDIVTSVRGLPLGIRDELQKLFGTPSLDIAEPGAEFERFDMIATPPLPTRRLVAAGCSHDDHCLVYYEKGGWFGGWRVALFRWTPAGTRLEWGGLAPADLATIDAVKEAVLAGKVAGPVKHW